MHFMLGRVLSVSGLASSGATARGLLGLVQHPRPSIGIATQPPLMRRAGSERWRWLGLGIAARGPWSKA